MSLTVNVKYLDGSVQGGEKYIKITFRDIVFKTTKVKGNANIYFGQRFSWPIARKIEKSDALILRLYSSSKIGSDKFIGLLNVAVANLLTNPVLSVRENLVDERLRMTDVVVAFDVEYFSPTTGNVNFSSNAFDYPVFNLKTLKRNDTRVQLPSENSSDEDEFFNSDEDAEPQDNVRDDISELSLLPEKNFKLPKHIDPQTLKIENFKVSVTIIEAKGLCGNNINPMFEVLCGKQKQSTEIKMQTNSPFFNEFFTFDLTMSRLEMMEQIIRLRGLSKSQNIVAQRVFTGKVLGEFSIDTKTVYTNENHSFFHKWAVLIDPKAPTSGEKGYVKVDISVLCAGDKPKKPEAGESEDNGNIEANLLIPQCVSNIPRKMCEMAVLVYQAEDLPCMNTSMIANIKHAIYGEGKALTDAYVEVSFAGFTGRTKVISRSYSPDWNQQVIFTERFPPFVTRLRIAVRDSDMVKDETISTIFIDLHKIMYAGSKEEEGFLPTYGPSWVNLYGTPRSYSYAEFVKGDRGQNQNLAEGVAYRGRLLMAIKTSFQPDSSKIGVDVRPCNPVSNSVAGKREMYLLFASIFETTLINEDMGISGKPLTFEMSIGITGNMLDDYAKTQAEKDNPTENQYIHSITQSRFPYTYDNKYFHIPYRNKKPCLFMITQCEDHRPRMFIPNILEKLKQQMCEYIRQTNYILICSKRIKARRYLRQSIGDFIITIDKVLSSVKTCRGTAKKTMLDVKYQRLIRLDLEKMKVKLKMINGGLSRVNVSEKLRECNVLVKLLEDKIMDPQYGLPDVFIYMIQENKRVAYSRIKARDIIHSAMPAEKGIMCGSMNTIYLKKMDNSLLPEKASYNIQAQLQLYIWLGLLKDMRGYKAGLPEGFSRDGFTGKMPPRFIDYVEESMFQLRVYLFMARNLIGSDDSGLSDPFARIIIGEHVVKSTIFEQTRSPIWDETIIIDNIIFNYSPEVLKSSPPNVVLEVFDWDSDTDEDFLGRVFCLPNVFIKGDIYVPPKLQWWNIYRGTLAAGDVLAAFDLIEVNVSSKKIAVKSVLPKKELERMTIEIDVNKYGEKEDDKLRIPYGIRPHLSTYRFEIIMWGVRQLQRIEVINVKKNPLIPAKSFGIFPINQPRVSIDIAGYRIESDKISDWNIQPNFEDNLVFVDLRLPTNTHFWPPISINCTNNTIFGIKQVVGNHVIINVADFYDNRVEELDRDIDKTTICDKSEHNFNVFGKTLDVDGIVNDTFEFEEDLLNEEKAEEQDELPPTANVDVTAPVPGRVERVKPEIPRDELESVDWWDRYYATLGDQTDSTKEKEVVEKISESESDEEVTGFVLNDIEVIVKSDDEDEDVAEIPDDIPKKKKKKKRRKKKKKKKYVNPFQKSSKALFLEEDTDDLKMEDEFITDNSWIERLTMYPCELENIKDFGGFHFPFKSFPLYRGKQEEDDEDYESPERFGGVFKGNVCIYSIDPDQVKDVEESDEDDLMSNDDEEDRELMEQRREERERTREEREIEKKRSLRLFKSLRDINPVEFLVRVYIIKAMNLHPCDFNGKSDPYILVKLGDKEIRNRDNYIPKTLNPMFGNCFELEVVFPQESFLLIQVYDWDRLTRDDLIGETTIDLENRWLSPHRGSCGIMPSYHNHGYLKWKDYQLPTAILRSLCEDNDIELPIYDKMSDKVDIAGRTYYAESMIEDDDGSQLKSLEPLALEVLQHWEEIVPGNKLVREYIEVRPLYIPDKPGIQQGLLEMWVDMYPAGTAIPAPIDITPRKPAGYELRVTIIQTEKVRLINVNFFTNEKTVDIFLKSWMKSTDIDLQKTDVHYKSLSGQGLFNYRFVFQFDYLKAEDSIVYKKKSVYEIDEAEYKTPCYLNMQVLDSGIILSDTIIGKFKFRLSKFPKPAKYYRTCDPFQHSDACAKFNLFKNKKVRGWWPLIYNPKDEDSDEEDGEEIGGCVELEMELISAEEAESNPVGLAREEPMPLEKPNRPDGSFLSFLNPCNTIMYFIKYRLKWILIKLLIITLALLLIVLFIYNFPGSFSTSIVNKIMG